MNIKKNILSLLLLFSFIMTAQNEYYELRTYIIPYDAAEKSLHNYLSKSLLPALNRQGVEHIGVFETIGHPTPKELVLLIPFNDIATYDKVLKGLTKDNIFQENKVGYDATFIANEDMKIGVVPLGYADGINRKLGDNTGHVLINENPAKIIGKISMDSMLIDLRKIEAKEGDVVTIFDAKNNISEIAKNLGTIPYEILATLNRRIKRIYSD